MYEMGRDIHTRVLRSEKGCRIRVTHVHTRSDCVDTRDDADRLNNASRFVRVIYSSHIVTIKLGTVTSLDIISVTFAAAICDADDPCSVNTAYDPESSFTTSPRSTTRPFQL